LLVVVNFAFDFRNNVSNVNATAKTLGWLVDNGLSTYEIAARKQIQADLTAAFPTQLTNPDSFFTAGRTNISSVYSSFGQWYNISLGLCDTTLSQTLNTTLMNIENALLNNQSALRMMHGGVLWQWLVPDDQDQFTFEVVWGPRVQDSWAGNSGADILGTFQTMLLPEDRNRLQLLYAFGIGIPFIGYSAILDMAIDGETDTPYTGDFPPVNGSSRYDIYTTIRNAILNASSTLRTVDPYFKHWITPCSFSGADSMKPLWALPLALFALW